MEFQITSKNKWRIFYRGLWISITLGVVTIIVLSIYFSEWWKILTLWLVIWGIVVDIGPGFYLFKEYLWFNRGSLLSIDNNYLSFKDSSDQSIYIEFNEIKKIIIYIPPNNYRETITMTAMEDFSYARFELKNGQEFYVTCLMVPKLKNFVTEYLSGVPVDYHRWWIFPSIRLCNYFRRKKGLLPTKTSEYSKEKPESKPGNELSSVES